MKQRREQRREEQREQQGQLQSVRGSTTLVCAGSAATMASHVTCDRELKCGTITERYPTADGTSFSNLRNLTDDSCHMRCN